MKIPLLSHPAKPEEENPILPEAGENVNITDNYENGKKDILKSRISKKPVGEGGSAHSFKTRLKIRRDVKTCDRPDSDSEEQEPVDHGKNTVNEKIDEILKDYLDTEYLLPELTEEEIDWVVERYWLKPPFSYVKIVKNWEFDLTYTIIEPKITKEELIVLEETYEYLRTALVFDSPKPKGDLTVDPEFVRKAIKSFNPSISDERTDILIYYLQRNFTGYGKLDPMMNDENIEDITCNGANIPLYIFHRKYSNLRTNLVFDNIELNKYVLKLAQKADKQLSLTTPIIDAALPTGARAQITYSDIVSSKGSSFTIRKFKTDPMTPADLISIGTYDAELMAFIWLAVENNKSIIIVGGTASGKTSTMNATSFFIPPIAKIVSIEDTREIQLPHENWLAMRTRDTGISATESDVDMFMLLKAALRQRPEYIIVGEVRGSEAQTLFQAMNTGHTTYSTLHAGGVSEAINRLTHEPINVPRVMFGALDLMIIQGLQFDEGHGFRRCLSINEMIVNDGDIRWNEIYKWDHINDKFTKNQKRSRILDDIAYTHGWDDEILEYNLQIRKSMLERFVEKKINDNLQISHFINELRKTCNR
ncbi:type II secretion system protein E [Methanolacinia petrolearia DSM 11571]|uniref:Type II secretion system protein E n=1 Tax=Methanolacinia petrolearia (strain DSM 11571 / OCM 486 / SEBR 4847) TaxID=679926 RepID=E1RKN8_METP4|nr:type II/IV secretion system ATPase subunit [Methanolacinia petrolearia]ADN36977.1 type II secretion system protein E [Methanolacinia petrolearia DSM 11571]